MLSVYTEVERFALRDVDPTDYYITHAYTGLDTLHLSLPRGHPHYDKLAEEVTLEAEGRLYTIKTVNEMVTKTNFTADLDLDDWRATYWRTYTSETLKLSQVLDKIMPTGWSQIGTATIPERRTIDLEDITSYDVLLQTMDTYNVVYQYDNVAKTVTVVQPELREPDGGYLTDQLNLRSLNFKGQTNELVTRLYPRGKDGLTIASVNGGKEYIEDTSYTGKIVSAAWVDERYTVAENLLADAKAKLGKLAYPVRSYECEAVDLAKTEGGKYEHLGLDLYRVVTLIDRHRRTRIDHRVVEVREYPLSPEQNVVTLSNTMPRIQSIIKEVQKQAEQASKDAAEVVNKVSGIDKLIKDEIADVTQTITGAKGGHVVTRFNAQNEPEEILIMDTGNTATAKNVWRWNLGGFAHSSSGIDGPYDTAITIDGKIIGKFISALVIVGKQITAGRIESADKSVYIDLDTGDAAVKKIIGENGVIIDLADTTRQTQNGAVSYHGARFRVGSTAFLHIAQEEMGARVAMLTDDSLLIEAGQNKPYAKKAWIRLKSLNSETPEAYITVGQTSFWLSPTAAALMVYDSSGNITARFHADGASKKMQIGVDGSRLDLMGNVYVNGRQI